MTAYDAGPVLGAVTLDWKARCKHVISTISTRWSTFEGYTEICPGLTGWTTSYDVTFRNYIKNMIDPWNEQETSEEEVSRPVARSSLGHA